MSLAADILRDAYEAGQKARDEHAAGVRATAEKLAEHLGNPWKWKLAAINEALREGAEIIDEGQGEEA